MDIKLWNENIPCFDAEFETPNVMTTFFIETDKPLPCVVVMPGGGYRRRVRHEAEPIAEFFNSRGFHAVIVEYRVAPNRFPSGLCDAQRAVRILRYNAEKWQIDPNRIVVCGFSAGGHLAASSLVYPEAYEPSDEIDEMSHIPSGGILCYPVISVEEDFGHVGSGKNLIGADRYEEEKSRHSVNNKVSDKAPPVFMWHTSDDGEVNVKNSLTFASALRDNGIPFEMHIFPKGKHGLGLATDRADVGQWTILAADWIERNVK